MGDRLECGKDFMEAVLSEATIKKSLLPNVFPILGVPVVKAGRVVPDDMALLVNEKGELLQVFKLGDSSD